MPESTRRDFLGAAAAGAAAMTLPRFVTAADDPHAAIQAEIVKRHAESVTRFREWVKQPAIAAENRAMSEGCQLMLKLAKEAGFQAAINAFEEIVAVVLNVEAQQVVAEQPVQQFLGPGANAEHFVIGAGDVPELGHDQVRPCFL